MKLHLATTEGNLFNGQQGHAPRLTHRNWTTDKTLARRQFCPAG
jgi:hypothetical protein